MRVGRLTGRWGVATEPQGLERQENAVTWLSVVRPLGCTIAAGFLAATLVASSAAAAPVGSCHGPSSQPPKVGSGDNGLSAVAATSACNAWAVGRYVNSSGVPQTLVEHWNGKAWKVQTSPNPGGSSQPNQLFGVAATSAANAWAVGYSGYSCCSGNDEVFIEHWNGKAWKVQTSPNPGGSSQYNQLHGVVATSAKNAWAVGFYSKSVSSPSHALIEHWNGRAWKIQPTPKGYNQLFGVAATSATNAWAVGGSELHTLVEHWNGKAWKIQRTPNGPNYEPDFYGVAATSATNAWAVGSYAYDPDSCCTAFVEHWNGKAWKMQKSPKKVGWLNAVAATSAKNAWAVGYGSIEHWNGKAWKVQPTPNYKRELYGVAVISATNAWAVGNYQNSDTTPYENLALRWNGTSWNGGP